MYIPDELMSRLLRCKASVVKVTLWLISRADENGTLDVSVRRLASDVGVSFQEARTAIAWCVSNTLINTVANTRTTHVTVCDIDTYRVGRKTTNTPTNTVDNTLKDKETEKDKSISPKTPIEKEKDKEKETLSIKRTRKIFQKPTAEEVDAYCREKGYSFPKGEDFIAYYDTNGWVQGSCRKPVKDWKACVRTWQNRQRYNNNTPNAEVGMIYRQEETDYSQGWD